MKKGYICLMLTGFVLLSGLASAQEIREYTAKRVSGTIEIDGQLDEPEWQNAQFTETFVPYNEDYTPRFPTKVQMLWDDNNLYIAVTMTDEDVWATYTQHDAYLWEEEVAEVFIDPDGDGLNYMELQANPLGTTLDLLMSKAYSEGGSSDFDWTLDGFSVGIGVDGTLNDQSDTDTKWICEIALSFNGMSSTAPSMNFPPESGDIWRLNVYRYDYDRTDDWRNELTGWNKTDSRGFHAPDKFGRVVFSDAQVGIEDEDSDLPGSTILINRIYPNPFNPSTIIEYELPVNSHVKLAVYDILGREVAVLHEGMSVAGIHETLWNGRDKNGMMVGSGMYLFKVMTGTHSAWSKALFLR